MHMGDAIAQLAKLPMNSAHMCVTSPPYWRMRDYGVAGQYGLEDTIDAYLTRQVKVFQEVRRVLRPDGVLCLNMGDRYSSGGRGGFVGDLAPRSAQYARRSGIIGTWQPPPPGYKDKELLGLPWRLAIALQADGWWLRADCIWSKPNPKPESAKDRPTTAHEYVFLLSRKRDYYYDWWGMREPASESERNRRARQSPATVRHFKLKRQDESHAPNGRAPSVNGGFVSTIARQKIAQTGTRNMRSVWTIPTQGFTGAHFATFPVSLAARCVRLGTSEHGCCMWCGAPYERLFTRCETTCISDAALKAQGVHRIRKDTKEYVAPQFVGWAPRCDCETKRLHCEPVPCTVLDPYAGAASTGVAALRLGRNFVGIELNPHYVEMARKRLADETVRLAEAK